MPSDLAFVALLATAPLAVLVLGGVALLRRRARRRAMERAEARERRRAVPPVGSMFRPTGMPASVPPTRRRAPLFQPLPAVHDESVVLPLAPLPPFDVPFVASTDAGEPWGGGGGEFSGGGASGSWDDDDARRAAPAAAAFTAMPLACDPAPSFDSSPSCDSGSSDSGSCDSGGCDSGGGSCGE
jgi:hypothetical protein